MNGILFTEDYWMNSQLSIVRYYGGCRIGTEEYLIVNKNGITVEELSDPDSKYYVGEGNVKAIEPGEPCDLVKKKWIPLYKELKRERFLALIKLTSKLDEAKKLIKEGKV